MFFLYLVDLIININTQLSICIYGHKKLYRVTLKRLAGLHLFVSYRTTRHNPTVVINVAMCIFELFMFIDTPDNGCLFI